MKKFKISLISGEDVVYNISAFVIFLTFSLIISSINLHINSIYAMLVAFLIGAKHSGEYVLYNNTAFQITNLCLGIIEMMGLALLFFFDRELKKALIPLLILFWLNIMRIIASILFGYEHLFRLFFELSVPALWLIFRKDLGLKLVNLHMFPTSRR